MAYRLLPALGLADDLPDRFPQALHEHLGNGLRCWQYPNQLAKYLVRLSRYPIHSYLEVGTAHGGTFLATVEYLRRFGQLKRAVALDIRYVPSLERYARTRPEVEVLKLDSASAEFEEMMRTSHFNLAFIDGDHSEAACQRDFDRVRASSQLVAFHDIVDGPSPGVGRVWRRAKSELSERYNFYEFSDQYAEVTSRSNATFLGIGLAVPTELDGSQ